MVESKIASMASSGVWSGRIAPAIEVIDLVKRYGQLEAVKGVTFAIAEGEIFGLLGPNGAGKTTVISVLATARRPSSGEARILGFSVTRARGIVRGQIGVVPQEVGLYPRLTASENIRFFGRVYRVDRALLEARIDWLLNLVGLSARRDDHVATYSGGMKRRLNLAVSLVHAPKILLFDEPTVGVDPQSREHIFDVVRKLRGEGAAILYTTHYMEEAERLCDRIGVMDEGKIIALGTLEELLSDSGGAEVVEIRRLPKDADLSRLRKSPGILRVETRDGLTRIFVENACRVLDLLAETLAPYRDRACVQIVPRSLGQYFIQLTGKELRD